MDKVEVAMGMANCGFQHSSSGKHALLLPLLLHRGGGIAHNHHDDCLLQWGMMWHPAWREAIL